MKGLIRRQQTWTIHEEGTSPLDVAIANASARLTELLDLEKHLAVGHSYDEDGFCWCGWDGNA